MRCPECGWRVRVVSRKRLDPERVQVTRRCYGLEKHEVQTVVQAQAKPRKPRPDVPFYAPEYVKEVRAMQPHDVLVWTQNPDQYASMIDKLRYLRRNHTDRDWHGFVSEKKLFVVRTK